MDILQSQNFLIKCIAEQHTIPRKELIRNHRELATFRITLSECKEQDLKDSSTI